MEGNAPTPPPQSPPRGLSGDESDGKPGGTELRIEPAIALDSGKARASSPLLLDCVDSQIVCTSDPEGLPVPAMSPEATYLKHLPSIERIAAFVARRNRLNGDETGEFIQIVRVNLFEDDYAIIRKFEGRSTFTTYLTTVILRMFHQWRVEQWGKWRPSAEAKRLGEKAILLEKLLTRDGLTLEEAVKTLTVRAGGEYGVRELELIYVRLPLRTPRPVLVSDGVSPDAVAVEGEADERLQERDRMRTARLAVASLDKALATFDPADRLLLQMRFWDGKKVPDIARLLRLDQKKIYKRLDKLFTSLRRSLEAAGVSKLEVDQLLGRGDQELRLGIVPGPDDEPPFPGGAPPGSETRGGEGVPR